MSNPGLLKPVIIVDPVDPTLQANVNGSGELLVSASVVISGISNTGVLTDGHSTVTVGGTSQQLFAINASRLYLFVQNPSSETESLFIDFTSNASTAAGVSIELKPGAAFEMTSNTFITTEKVTVNAVTTGHKFIAKEGE